MALVCLIGWPIPASGQSPAQKRKGLAFLKKLQTEDGSFRMNAKAKSPSLRATSASLRAIRYFGGEVANAKGCLAFVRKCRDEKSGGFADEPGGKPSVILTSVGLMALAELKGLDPKVEKAAIAYMAKNAKGFEDIRMAAAALETVGKKCEKNEAWLKELSSLQNKDGTFGKGAGQARDTGGGVAAILRLGGKVKDREKVLSVLHNGMRNQGGFGTAEKPTKSDLESTYRVMRTFKMLKSKPKNFGAVRLFIKHCTHDDGGIGIAPVINEAPSAAGTYFGAIILHWLDAK
jgi:prenyltransferase beta subunit